MKTRTRKIVMRASNRRKSLSTTTFVAEVVHALAAEVLSLKVCVEALLRGELLFGGLLSLALLRDALLLLLQAIVQRTWDRKQTDIASSYKQMALRR